MGPMRATPKANDAGPRFEKLLAGSTKPGLARSRASNMDPSQPRPNADAAGSERPSE